MAFLRSGPNHVGAAGSFGTGMRRCVGHEAIAGNRQRGGKSGGDSRERFGAPSLYFPIVTSSATSRTCGHVLKSSVELGRSMRLETKADDLPRRSEHF